MTRAVAYRPLAGGRACSAEIVAERADGTVDIDVECVPGTSSRLSLTRITLSDNPDDERRGIAVPRRP